MIFPGVFLAGKNKLFNFVKIKGIHPVIITARDATPESVKQTQQHLQKFKIVKEKLNKSFKNFDQEEINNAYILSLYRYYGKFHTYYKVHKKLGNNLQETIAFFNNTAHSSENPKNVISNFLQ